MTPLSFLVLTDHRGHSTQNSLYALVTTLARDPRCARVAVASRGDARNEAFFRNSPEPSEEVWGFQVREELKFAADGGRFNGELAPLHPEDYDVVWLRLPHPVQTERFERLQRPGTLVVNDPAGIARTGDKSFLLHFPEWTPPVRLVHSAGEVRTFARNFPLVLKPLRAYGGQGIVRVDGPDALPDLDFREPYLAMKFLKNVSEGDKRILVVNGKILAASLRIPPPGEWLCNVARGGTSVGADVTPEEIELIDALAPELLRHGICFCGVDTLTNDDGRRVLSEINTLSIGGFPQAEAQTGRPILQQTIDEFLTYCHDHLTR
ncbi:RimK family alpha-L-glutamate ligase [Lewinella sp. JB7]|uniref:ATP-grasp domain-containing protein n=1 Tax=Lewinella sp. JB7 TaxID=2962887 RepID=UPI0020C9E5C9|nr:hypothetical protein [Lewinella sp. JB7]MCP9236665.1 hypothetical protein [Lewinella sp. JB7]